MAEKLDEKKLQILKVILKKGKASVAEIVRETGIPRSTLNHHLSLLVREGYTAQERKGKEVENRVRPLFAQKLRKKLRIKAPKTLISGYTFDPNKPDPKTLELLQRAVKFLEKEIKVDKTIAFTTPLAQEKIIELGYLRGDEEVAVEYEVYSNRLKEIERLVRKKIDENILSSDILIDLTPLSKLFTIVCLSLAKEYGLRTFYHAGERIIWLS